MAVFRQGDMVVMHRLAALPNLCFFNGEPASSEPMSVSLKYDEPWVRMMALFGALIYALFSAAASKTATVNIPVSQTTWDSRWWWTWFCWGLFGVGLLIFVGGCVGLVSNDRGPLASLFGIGMLVGLLTMIAAPIVGYFSFRQVACYFMDDHYIWMTGAHPNFLAVLPAWPFPPR